MSTFVGPVTTGGETTGTPLPMVPLNGVVVTVFVCVTVYWCPEPTLVVQTVFMPPASVPSTQPASETRTSIGRRLQRTDSPGVPVAPGVQVPA